MWTNPESPTSSQVELPGRAPRQHSSATSPQPTSVSSPQSIRSRSAGAAWPIASRSASSSRPPAYRPGRATGMPRSGSLGHSVTSLRLVLCTTGPAADEGALVSLVCLSQRGAKQTPLWEIKGGPPVTQKGVCAVPERGSVQTPYPRSTRGAPRGEVAAAPPSVTGLLGQTIREGWWTCE